jgi:hypothetical protein
VFSNPAGMTCIIRKPRNLAGFAGFAGFSGLS